MPAVGTLVAVHIGAYGRDLNLPVLSTCTLAISNALLAAGSMVINDWFDVETDQVNKPHRPIPSGRVRRGQALVLAVGLLASGLVGTFYISNRLTWYAGLVIVLSIAYSIYIKKLLFAGNILVAALASYPFVAGGILTQNLNVLIIPSAATFLFIFGREILKAAQDTEGDARYGVISVAGTFGTNRAVYLGLFLMTASTTLGIGQYLRGINSESFVVVVIPGILLQLGLSCYLVRRISRERLKKTLSYSVLVMLWGTLSFTVGLR